LLRRLLESGAAGEFLLRGQHDVALLAENLQLDDGRPTAGVSVFAGLPASTP